MFVAQLALGTAISEVLHHPPYLYLFVRSIVANCMIYQLLCALQSDEARDLTYFC